VASVGDNLTQEGQVAESVHNSQEAPRNDLETLQAYSFKIIHELMALWDGFEKKGSRGKGRKFSYGALIHRMIIDAMRYHQDISQLAEIVARYEELKAEYDLAARSGILNGEVQAPQQAVTTA
jgi:phosphodiesterase/alkaline phosphatase D-like protein